MPTKLPPGQYYGRPIRRRAVAGLLLSETGYEPGVRLPRHGHEGAHFCLVRHGGLTEAVGRRTRTLGPREVAYHPAGVVHAPRFHDIPARLFHIELTPDWLGRAGEYAGPLASGQEFRDGTAAALALKLYQEFHHADSVTPLVIEGLALELMGELSRKDRRARRRVKSPPVWVMQARDLIEARFTEQLTLEGVAAEVGVHPFTLSSVFRRTYRCAVGERVRQLRVEYAAEQLADTNLPIETIARQAGFCSTSHLSIYFKKQSGQTPSAFRHSLRRSG
jgi:AraC family transcriptional regulator